MAAIACYCIACALWLGSDTVAIPPPLIETVVFFVGLNLALGLSVAHREHRDHCTHAAHRRRDRAA